jgi:hypothetical protein
VPLLVLDVIIKFKLYYFKLIFLLLARNFQSMCFGCFLGGASMGIYQFSGGSLKGLYNPHDSDAQYYRRKEFLQSDAEREEKEKFKQAAKEATQLYN